MFKINDKDTRPTTLTSFWYIYYYLWTDFTPCSGVFTVDFEQENVCKLVNGIFHANCENTVPSNLK